MASGKWIVENEQGPSTDLSTCSVSRHPYVDLHWRLIYTDGIAAIFANDNDAEKIPEMDFSRLLSTEAPESRFSFKDWCSAGFLGNRQAARLIELHCNR
jgi:hypothetical protein